jgi:phosphoserine phosphatase RsbU/P
MNTILRTARRLVDHSLGVSVAKPSGQTRSIRICSAGVSRTILTMPQEMSLNCMEVWGGNQSADSSVRLTGLDAWVYCRPYAASSAGGDVYYVSSCATGRITRMLVADVSGHGESVSAMAVVLRDLMRRHVNHHDQVKFVRRMNEAFVHQSKLGTFATAVVSTYFSPTRTLMLCNAGHPPPLIWRQADQRWEFVENDREETEELANVPLGIADLVEYEQFEVTLAPGDRVICYTDSLPEARLADGRLLGMQALLAIANEVDGTDAQTLIPRLLAMIETRCGRMIAGDDITVLLFAANIEREHTPLTNRVLAPWRIIRGTLGAIVRGSMRFPLPDLRVRNVLGAMIPPLERRK